MKLLFIGGTGIISSACVTRALSQGHNVTVLNRGQSTTRPLPNGARAVHADIHDPDAVRGALGDEQFDSVTEFVAFQPEQVRSDIELFADRAGQYVFISSASAYQTPPQVQPITEDTPLDNPFWQYSRDKIACEQAAFESGRQRNLPITVVRPSHTYDRTGMPLLGGWTAMDRLRRGAPVIVPGDGTSLWTITHTDDVAVGLVGLLGNPAAYGEAFHITNSAPITWDRITRDLAAAAGVEPTLCHVASESIVAVMPDWTEHVLGDLAHSRVFDNRKVAALVPDFDPRIDFGTGAQQIVEWYDAHPDRQTVDADTDAAFDRMVERHDAFAS